MWKKHPESPIFGRISGQWFDVCVLHKNNIYYMYASFRAARTVMRMTSTDGVHFDTPKQTLIPPADPLYHYNRACVLISPQGEWLMYVTAQYNPPDLENATSEIILFKSKDGIEWDGTPIDVIKPDRPWEKNAVMCPHVLYDDTVCCYKMWYSGGEQYEPDAIGYAESADGIHWIKHKSNPIFSADANCAWERYKVTACQVIKSEEGYRMFYTGFSDIDTASIGIAYSKDGIENWKRYSENPIIAPHETDWDRDACYKPFAWQQQDGWKLWYNGRRASDEFICLAESKTEKYIKKGDFL